MKQYLSLLFLILLAQTTFSQLDSNYSKFLILKSQEIDYFPVWGSTDDVIYINILSKEWRKYDLTKSNIVVGDFNEHELGINTASNYTIETDIKTINKLKKDTAWKVNEVYDQNKNFIQLISTDYSSTLLINNLKVMDINGVAHSIALSPSGKYFACLFELTGLMIFDIQKELIDTKARTDKYAKMSNFEKADYIIHNTNMQGLEKCLNSFTVEEKTTVDYNYYFGILSYFKCFNDTSLIQSAIDNLSKACTDSRFYNSYVMLAGLYFKKGDWENSLKFADKAIEFNPQEPIGYLTKALYYEKMNETEKACEYFKKAADKGDEWAQEKLIKCK